jgi:hypothetical protein
MPKNLVFLLLLACSLCQCTEVSNLGDDIGRQYFPVQVGNYWIYEVSEATFTNQLLQEPGDSIIYQVRERVDTVFRDQTGELTYLLIRSRRTHPGQAWGGDSVVTINKSLSDLRYTRDNLTTVKLVFPLAGNKKWNGNAFNSRDPEEYYFVQVGQPFILDDSTYNNTVRVVQVWNENLLELQDRQEVYALGIGLLYKKTIDLDYCNGGAGQNCQVGQHYVVHGRRILQKLIAFGRNE